MPLNSIMYPQYKTSSVIKKVVENLLICLGMENSQQRDIENKLKNISCDESDVSVGSSLIRATKHQSNYIGI